VTAGTAKPQKPTVRVGSFDPTVLSQQACVKAIYPAAKGGRIDVDADAEKIVHVESFLIGSVDLCRIDHASATASDPDAVVEIAAVKRAPKPTVIARLSPLTSFKHLDMAGERSDAITLSDFPLTTTQTALFVTDEESTIQMGGGSGKTTARLYRIGATDLTQLLEVNSSWSAGEDGDSTRCTLQPVAALAVAMPDLEVTCVSTHDRYPGDKGDRDRTSKTTERYRWKNGAYATTTKKK